ncbi:hypothetical protein PP935_gp210 [Rhizobium phage RHph_N34]|uniref:Uncharacterized protein n=1 Tax=Rhizobium phage RHph_N34 TaxID=2509586 RepID=A0A7S5RA94_9CAUD|nr:hypothetical protein PP935_gp210 [Rhizobium phage RHph_N34]QIG73985.1 hypothetical protein EVC06_210 [Rhizobium phage RHph_N34]
MVIKKTTYVTADGQEFATHVEAEIHEKETLSLADREYSRYINQSYSGQRLLEKHHLDEYGTWKVEGEDPNCDMGGPHHCPHLGYFEGELEAVIRKAVMLDRFWQWGSGGNITKVEKQVVEKV